MLSMIVIHGDARITVFFTHRVIGITWKFRRADTRNIFPWWVTRWVDDPQPLSRKASLTCTTQLQTPNNIPVGCAGISEHRGPLYPVLLSPFPFIFDPTMTTKEPSISQLIDDVKLGKEHTISFSNVGTVLPKNPAVSNLAVLTFARMAFTIASKSKGSILDVVSKLASNQTIEVRLYSTVHNLNPIEISANHCCRNY